MDVSIFLDGGAKIQIEFHTDMNKKNIQPGCRNGICH